MKSVKKITKVVGPFVGFGNRFHPETKAMLKELLPIVDKPSIQYAAEEAVAAGIDTLIVVTGRNNRANECHFEENNELETMLGAKGKDAQADMVCNIISEGLGCIFVRQAEELGFGRAVLHWNVQTADDLLTDYEPGVPLEIAQAFASTGKSQLSGMEVDGPDISKYVDVLLNWSGASILGLVQKPNANDAASNLVSIRRYALNTDIFETLKGLSARLGGKILSRDAINMHVQKGSVETVRLIGRRFDTGSVDGFFHASGYEYEQRLASYYV